MEQFLEYMIRGGLPAAFVALTVELLKPTLLLFMESQSIDLKAYGAIVNTIAAFLGQIFAFATALAASQIYDSSATVITTILIGIVATALATLGWEGLSNFRNLVSKP